MLELKPLIIGHRGAPAYLPENTLESFHLAVKQFYAGMIEFDVRMTRDGVPVVFHDAHLHRMTGINGYLSSYTFKELRELTLLTSAYIRSRYRSDSMTFRIPSLESVLTEFPKLPLAIEIKERDPSCLPVIIDRVKRLHSPELCVIGSKYKSIGDYIEARYPTLKRFCSRFDLCRLLTENNRRSKKITEEPNLVASMPLKYMSLSLRDPSWINFLHEKKMTAFYWTINDQETIKSLALLGADGIITDNAKIANQALARETDPTID